MFSGHMKQFSANSVTNSSNKPSFDSPNRLFSDKNDARMVLYPNRGSFRISISLNIV